MHEIMFEKLIPLVKKFEGFSAEIYHCPAGMKTIGYGHVVSKEESFTCLTEPEAEALLVTDLKRIIKHLERLIITPLHINQLAALTSFTFNVGPWALQRSTLRQKVNRSEHKLVPDEMRKWVWCQGKIVAGLKVRREAEAALYSGDH